MHPFEKAFQDLVAADLACLREVSEGWYVEYKSTAIAPRALAKSLSAFANQYGGYLFLALLHHKICPGANFYAKGRHGLRVRCAG